MSDVFKQCTELVAKEDFTFLNPDTNRNITVKKGSLWWVTTCNHDRTDAIGIARKGKNMGSAYFFPLSWASQLWKIRTNEDVITKPEKRKPTLISYPNVLQILGT